MVFCFLKPASRAYVLVGACAYVCIIAEGVVFAAHIYLTGKLFSA